LGLTPDSSNCTLRVWASCSHMCLCDSKPRTVWYWPKTAMLCSCEGNHSLVVSNRQLGYLMADFLHTCTTAHIKIDW